MEHGAGIIGDQIIITREGSQKGIMMDKEPRKITKDQETNKTMEGTRTLTQKEAKTKINQIVTTTTTLQQMKTIGNMTTTNPGKQVGNMAT